MGITLKYTVNQGIDVTGESVSKQEACKAKP